MKKRLLIILTLLLCVSLAACNLAPPSHSDNFGSTESTDSSDPNLTEKIYFPLEKESPPTDKKHIPSNPHYIITTNGGHFIKSSHINNNYFDEPEVVSDSTLYTIQIGKKEIQAYLSTIWYGGETYVFLNEEKNMQYRISTFGNCFSVVPQNKSVRVRYEGNDFSEESLLDFIKNYISDFVDIRNIDDYTYSCITHVSVSIPQYSSMEERDGFYVSEDLISEDSTEEVKIRRYKFQFVKYCNGYKTGDRITVECTADGEIIIFEYNDYGVNWDDYAIFTKPEQMDKIKKKIADYLPNVIDEKWTLKSFEPGEPMLVYRNGEPQLTITYHIEVEDTFGYGRAAGLCYLRVFIE